MTGAWICKVHNRSADYVDANGKRSCDPKLGGIMLPCDVYFEVYDPLIHGCGDGSCVIKRPEGQHTNGGCRCRPHTLRAKILYLEKCINLALDAFEYGDAINWDELEKVLSKKREPRTHEHKG